MTEWGNILRQLHFIDKAFDKAWRKTKTDQERVSLSSDKQKLTAPLYAGIEQCRELERRFGK